MQIVQHRVNSLTQLKNTPAQYGVELDIRDKYDQLIVTHDAFSNGDDWENYLEGYHHELMIANVKTEGIEKKIIQDLQIRNIQNYFLLDVSLPFLVKLSNDGFKHMAIRFSEYEPIELAAKFAGKVNWVWVDCFTQLPLNGDNYNFLKNNFQICIVSPELQGHSMDRITEFKEQLHLLPVDAVCTKMPKLWLS
jgi:hypothetical protein